MPSGSRQRRCWCPCLGHQREPYQKIDCRRWWQSQNNGSHDDGGNGNERTTASIAVAAVATTMMLTVADDDGGHLWKQKGEGARPTWLLSIIN